MVVVDAALVGTPGNMLIGNPADILDRVVVFIGGRVTIGGGRVTIGGGRVMTTGLGVSECDEEIGVVLDMMATSAQP